MSSRTRGILSIVAAVMLLLGVTAGITSAQCLTPDGLEGPCCMPASANLPNFPNMDVITRYVCWRDCDVNFNTDVRAEIKHNPVACGYSLIRFDITNVGGALDIWKGKLIAAYSRTWMETSPSSSVPNTQVWRFLVNGDFVIDPFIVTTYGSNTCVVPPSYATYGKVLVTGYIDYAFNCDTNTWSVAYALGHECDVYEHTNSYSARPGSFGNLKTYNWVGPSAGFVLDPTIPVADGVAVSDGMRNYDFAVFPNVCRTEQPVVQGDHEQFVDVCRCTSATPINQFKVSRLGAISSCGSTAFSRPEDAWIGLQSKSIGRWTDPTIYPGDESLHLQQGFFDYTDGCSGASNLYYFKGTHTQGGYPVEKWVGTTTTPASNRLIDLGSAIPTSGVITPAVGRRYISDRMIYLHID